MYDDPRQSKSKSLGALLFSVPNPHPILGQLRVSPLGIRAALVSRTALGCGGLWESAPNCALLGLKEQVPHSEARKCWLDLQVTLPGQQQEGRCFLGRRASQRIYESTGAARGSRQAEVGGRDLGVPRLRDRGGC